MYVSGSLLAPYLLSGNNLLGIRSWTALARCFASSGWRSLKLMADGKSFLAVVFINRLPALQIRCSRRLLLKKDYTVHVLCVQPWVMCFQLRLACFSHFPSTCQWYEAVMMKTYPHKNTDVFCCWFVTDSFANVFLWDGIIRVAIFHGGLPLFCSLYLCDIEFGMTGFVPLSLVLHHSSFYTISFIHRTLSQPFAFLFK